MHGPILDTSPFASKCFAGERPCVETDASVPSTGVLRESGADESTLSFELTQEDLIVGQKIGSGHTCDVYEGYLRSNKVAIKMLHLRKMNPRNFSREVAIMSNIEHPHIVRLLGVVLDSFPFQVAMEYCAGGACFEVLHNRPDICLQWEQQLTMCRQCAVAMEYLHSFSPPVIHRDLKSLNLLLNQPVSSPHDCIEVKVSDFGLARKLETKDGQPLTKGVGTTYWMAPEVFSSSSYNEKVDLYSYGMVLYEIICRRIPFEGIQPQKVLELVKKGYTPELSCLPVSLPAELQDLIQRCWALEPSSRPSFEEILQILAVMEWLGESRQTVSV